MKQLFMYEAKLIDIIVEQVWGGQNPHEAIENERDSPILNFWCGITI